MLNSRNRRRFIIHERKTQEEEQSVITSDRNICDNYEWNEEERKRERQNDILVGFWKLKMRVRYSFPSSTSKSRMM